MAFPLAGAILILLSFLVVKLFLSRTTPHIKSLHRKHVVITGGSSGIGFALAKTCVARGAYVTLMARTESNLIRASQILTKTFGCQSDQIFLKAVDVGDIADVSLAIEESFRRRPIDILICNAGQAIPGLLDDVSFKDLESVAKTNFLGCAYAIRAALPLMKTRSLQNPCSIVLLSSLSSLFVVPGFNLYTSTKYALRGLAESLRLELTPRRIRVNLVCPGYTETLMLDEVDKLDSTSSELLNKLFFYNRASAKTPDEVAARAIEGVKKGDFLITTSFDGFLLRVLARGVVPAESVETALIELACFVPARILSFIWFVLMRRLLQKQVEDNLKQKHTGLNTYIHSIDDSAADDDGNLHLWSH